LTEKIADAQEKLKVEKSKALAKSLIAQQDAEAARLGLRWKYK